MTTVDINHASAAELDAVDGLRGHGPEIVRYRAERGRFTDVRQLDEVPGCAGKLSAEQRAALSVGQGSVSQESVSSGSAGSGDGNHA
ncbi:ComEA family DNA-binding protein [Sphingomonas abietis]|uniref:Helix-hairpin-helix domain-containing protein n=1 Tax=Sphingomonas abietis TaxID=3012344 RepID=A0ABY7NL75_9SPHN|nr:helix-hairpin-helix domain-containing protein [Sphingomonas abietis]WBO21373.1 helix-hairpin-helix domain-containing protein [Sphingomonas abietis]